MSNAENPQARNHDETMEMTYASLERVQERGQSLVETAIVLPILLLLLVFIIDAARAFDAYIVLSNATREGARFAALEPSPDDDRIRSLVVDDVLGSGTNITHMEDFTSTHVAMLVSTNAVTVTATYEFPLWFGGLVGVPAFDLEREAVMPRRGDLEP